jgi:beta-phosphoglucomutase-like phosphatase (HAD superfamily)
VQLGAVAARTGHDPAILKPSPYLIRRAASGLGTVPSACAMIGDSPSDIAAARSAQASSIGYTTTPGGTQQLLAAGAELVELLRPMRDDIVEVETPETGTPLPGSYQAAPPLM